MIVILTGINNCGTHIADHDCDTQHAGMIAVLTTSDMILVFKGDMMMILNREIRCNNHEVMIMMIMGDMIVVLTGI